MNLQHLRYLLAVARTGSFTRAAGTMHVTQPTVSSAVAELESELGVRLFNRSGRSAQLTMEGRTLVNYAIGIQDLVDEARDRLTNRNGTPQGGFRFGAIDAAAIYLLPETLREFLDTRPGIELTVEVAGSRQLVRALLENRSEFAFITLPFDHDRLKTLSLYNDPLVLVVGGSHDFARKKLVTLQQVALEPLILFHADSISRRVIDARFRKDDLSPRVVMEMGSPEAMRKLVEVGVGISFLPRLTVRDALESGTLREVGVRNVRFHREIGIAWKKTRYFGPAIEALLTDVAVRFDKAREFGALLDRKEAF